MLRCLQANATQRARQTAQRNRKRACTCALRRLTERHGLLRRRQALLLEARCAALLASAALQRRFAASRPLRCSLTEKLVYINLLRVLVLVPAGWRGGVRVPM